MIFARTSDSRRTSSSSPSTLISVPPYLEYRTSSPSETSSGRRWPLSSSLPSPTARTLPFWGFSFAVSGRTMPEAVVSSSSTALTIRRSPRGLSFIRVNLRWMPLALRYRECQPTARILEESGQRSRPAWHSVVRSASGQGTSLRLNLTEFPADTWPHMHTIGFRSNILFAIAAACGVVAALGRPWYAATPVGADGQTIGELPTQMEDFFSGLGRAFSEQGGITGWAALHTADRLIAG